jgi:hypothetical protein
MQTKRWERGGQDARGGEALIVVICVLMAFVTPFTPLLVGALEIALFDQEMAKQWVESEGVLETIAAFYRALGMPC